MKKSKWDLSKNDLYLFESLAEINSRDFWRMLVYCVFLIICASFGVYIGAYGEWIFYFPAGFLVISMIMTTIYSVRLKKKFNVKGFEL